MAPANSSDPQQAGMASSAGSRLAPLWQRLQRTPALVTAMAVLGLGLIGSSAVLVKGIRTAKDTITVTGASTERIRSDYVDWSVLVSQGALASSSPTGRCSPWCNKPKPFYWGMA